VDAALVAFDGHRPRLLTHACVPYPPLLAESLAEMVDAAVRPTESAMRQLDPMLVEVFADAVRIVLQQADLPPASASKEVVAIGSHGQTVWHDPNASPAETIQLGSPEALARVTGHTTVGFFRQADLGAGGQGAPLAPLLHRELFRPESGCRAVINLGGIANVSLVRSSGEVSGFDTGPANCLMDAWIRRHLGKPYDEDGAWAASGRTDAELLTRLLDDPYFERQPPKSTGVEHFNLQWLDQRLQGRTLLPEDVQATLCDLSAHTVASSLPIGETGQILVCGGGSHNSQLLRRIAHLSGRSVETTAAAGLHPDWVEAVLFAWLARERLAGRAQDTRNITGAATPVMLGEVFSPPR
jgi:anhydro-N-acetylmuramic acid kinase